MWSRFLVLAARIAPFDIGDTFEHSEATLSTLYDALAEEITLFEVLSLFLVGWVTVPLVRVLYCISLEKTLYKFEHSYTYQVALHVSQAAKVGCVVYIIDCVVVGLNAIGFLELERPLVVTAVAKIVYMLWLANRLSVGKRYLLGKAVQKSPEKLGKSALYDHLIDSAIYSLTLVFILDLLSVQLGTGIASLFAMGGVGTLVFSLACKDLAAQFVSGLVLSTQEKFYVGDIIRLGDGTEGSVGRIGWMDTEVRFYDNVTTRIPNSQMATFRISNLSRVKLSRVKLFLSFHHEDIDRLPNILADFLEEIKAHCPDLVTDGSRPCRAKWCDIKPDCLEAFVDVHFNSPPMGAKYHDNREEVLKAIGRVMKKHEVSFALPAYTVDTRKSLKPVK